MSPLSEHQYAYLRGLAKSETTADEEVGKSPVEKAKAKVLAYFTDKGLANDEAVALRLLEQCVTTLANAPLTITFKAEILFKDLKNVESDTYQQFFDTFRENVDLGHSGVARSTAKGTRFTPNALDRGADYGSWRREKDERAIANSGLSIYELPTFAAVRTDPTAPNLYGNYHLELKREVRKRAAYSYGTGVERRDLYMLLGDIVDHGMPTFLKAMSTGSIRGTEVEIHIYGPVRLDEDVSVIHFPPSLSISMDAQKDLLAQSEDDLTEFQSKMAAALAVQTNYARNVLSYARGKGIPCDGGAYNALITPKVDAPQAVTTLPVTVKAAAQKQGQAEAATTSKGKGGLFSFWKKSK
jgi:hypothetical protein